MMKLNLVQFFNLVYIILLGYICIVLSDEGRGKCSRKAKVTKENNQKVVMIKRIPSKCSNWDRSWAWITKMDCGTKYVTTYVENPIYKTEYFCCPDDNSCKAKAEEQYASEERFLVITFGSATAALVVIVLIIVISICHRKQYGSGFIFWKRQRCEYIPASGKGSDLSLGCHVESRNQNEYINGDQKLIEPVYEEINDRTPDWSSLSEKLPIVDGVFEKNVPDSLPNNDTNEDKSLELLTNSESVLSDQDKSSNDQDKSLNDHDDYAKLNSFIEYIKSAEAKETLHKENLQSDVNNEYKNEKLQNNEKDNDTAVKNSNERIVNEYTEFCELIKCESPKNENDLQSGDRVHEYEHLDSSTREQPSEIQMYSPLDSSNQNKEAQSFC